jgi:hypothetical protein
LLLRHVSEVPASEPADWQLLELTVFELACGEIKFKHGDSEEQETTPTRGEQQQQQQQQQQQESATVGLHMVAGQPYKSLHMSQP